MCAVQRLRILYSGRVQGVGFRATVARLARDFEITGRVCNLSDGRVEVEAEGQRDELERFRDRIAVEMQRNISHHSEQWSPAAGIWATFEVAYDKSL
jgi:acylphosphatase